MAVRVEKMALTDPRFYVLGQLRGTSRREALGLMIEIWDWCTERNRHDIPVFFLAAFAGDGVQPHLLAVQLAGAELGEWLDCTEPENHPESCRHLRIRGTAGRVEWLEDARSSQLAGAVAGGKKRAQLAARDEKGRLLPSSSPSLPPAELEPARPQLPPASPAVPVPVPVPVPAQCDLAASPPLTLTADRPGGGKRKRAATALPQGWKPNGTHQALARDQRVDLDREAAKFTDWAAAKDQRYANWDAAFSNWLRNARSYGAPPVAGALPPPADDAGRFTTLAPRPARNGGTP